MFLITSISIAFIIYKWPEDSIFFAFVVALIMEYVNAYGTDAVKKLIETKLDEKYQNTIIELKEKKEEEYKRAEMNKDEADKWKKLFDKKD